MALKHGKVTIAILIMASLVFGGFLLVVTAAVPGEYEMIVKIAILEKLPPPTACPKPFEREGLLAEVTKMAIIYKSYKKYEQATPYFLRIIELRKQLCGETYPGLVIPMGLLAENYELSGSPEKAALLRKEIKIRDELLKNQILELQRK